MHKQNIECGLQFLWRGKWPIARLNILCYATVQLIVQGTTQPGSCVIVQKIQQEMMFIETLDHCDVMLLLSVHDSNPTLVYKIVG